MSCWCRSTVSSPPVVICKNGKDLTRRRCLTLHHRPESKLQQLPEHNLITFTGFMETETATDCAQNDETAPSAQIMSKNAQKRLLKQQRYEAKKAEKKAEMKAHRKREVERKRKEWQEKLESLGDEEREKLIEDRKDVRKERMEKRNEEKGKKMERLKEARLNGQNFVIDLEFAHLMTPSELHSLVQQIMYCYAMNGRCVLPAHLWLTGCQGEMQNQLLRIPGYDKWAIEKEDRSYVEAFKDQKENLVYLTADSENTLDELDPKAIYIIGGLVDRNRWKGITMNKANEQGIKTAKLPIGAYLKMSSSQVLTVNQVVEILLKYLETKDWKVSFFEVIPQRKRFGVSSEDNEEEIEKNGINSEEKETPEKQEAATIEDEDSEKVGRLEGDIKRQCIEA